MHIKLGSIRFDTCVILKTCKHIAMPKKCLNAYARYARNIPGDRVGELYATWPSLPGEERVNMLIVTGRCVAEYE